MDESELIPESGDATSTYGRSGELSRSRRASVTGFETTEDESESLPSIDSSVDSRDARSLEGWSPVGTFAAVEAAPVLWWSAPRVSTPRAGAGGRAAAASLAFLDFWWALRSVVYSQGLLRR